MIKKNQNSICQRKWKNNFLLLRREIWFFFYNFSIYPTHHHHHHHHAEGMLIVYKWRKIQWHSEDPLMAQQHPMLTCLVTNFHLQRRNYFYLHKRSKHWNFIISQPCRRQASAVGVSQLNCPIRNSISYHAL